ncbi:MAG: tRNA (guanosine(46)-N7)-methyltransferase TrmB [Rhodothermaeota bacterium MED-G64]|nr:MAG: tRNA (guanosine(46)-N7)-methyltransferase TrmB [Rhodothermaeota bacterium MED-G64]
MAKNKLGRYAEVEVLPNVSEVSELGMWKGLDEAFWLQTFGVESLDLTLELACGKGEYALALAQRYPERQFIGIDIKGERLWRGAKEALDLGLTNLHFLRVYIDHLELYIPEASVDEIWIPFSDPYLKQGKESKRLTSPRFLAEYRRILRPNGIVHVKTDSPELADYTREQIGEGLAECAWVEPDIYAGNNGVVGDDGDVGSAGMSPEECSRRGIPPELLTVQTYYEKKHIASGRTICYIGLRPTRLALAHHIPLK